MRSGSPRRRAASSSAGHRAGCRRRAPRTPLRALRQQLAVMHGTLDRMRRSSSTENVPAPLGKMLCSIAQAARVSGMMSYCSITLHVLEQVYSAQRTRYVAVDMRELLCEWVRLSWAYLIAPEDRAVARELIEHMGNRRWERPVCRALREALLESMQAEALSSIAKPRRALPLNRG